MNNNALPDEGMNNSTLPAGSMNNRALPAVGMNNLALPDVIPSGGIEQARSGARDQDNIWMRYFNYLRCSFQTLF
ncbi:MAG: hypothetical protein GY737_26915 [Desulfobacteraceae bacterium]|nr:hypothetical protein [Desulfobacteraceae bacterium]